MAFDHRVDHVGVLNAPQGELDRTLEAGQPFRRIGDVFSDVVLMADRLVAQRLDKWPCDRSEERESRVRPSDSTAKVENRNPNDDALGQFCHLRVPLHHLLVGENVRPSDVERTVDV